MTVNKDAIPDDPWDFALRRTQGSGLSSFFLDDDGDETNDLKSTKTFTLNASQLGEKQITETPDTDWTLTGLDCTGDDGLPRHQRAPRDLDVDAGETIVCDFENTKHASLTVVKETDPASDPQDFDFDLTGTGLATDLDLDTDATDANLTASHSLQPQRLAARRQDGDRVRARRLDADRPHLHAATTTPRPTPERLARRRSTSRRASRWSVRSRTARRAR